nr:hypothetical protein Iba_chr11cCG3130 [Ipomoea batatas]
MKKMAKYSITLIDWSSGDLASKDLIYKILTRETSMVSITLFGSILRMKANTASRISASISCSLDAPALMTAARTCNSHDMAARLSYCSGSKSFKADVRYSPAGVLLIFSVPGLTKATVPSDLSDTKGKDKHHVSMLMVDYRIYLPMSRLCTVGPLGDGLDT